MAGGHADAVVVELVAEIVGSADGALEEFILAGGLVVGDGTLHEFTHVEGLVAEVPVVHPLLAPVPLMEGVVNGPVGLEVSVGLLCGANLVDDAVDVVLQLGVGTDHENVGGSLEDFIDLGIVVGLSALEGEVALLRLAGEDAAGILEVADLSGGLHLGEGVADGVVLHGVEALAPEDVVEVDAGEGHGINDTLCEGAQGQQGRYDGDKYSFHVAVHYLRMVFW